ncbi:predicted protein [Naegleria gruberi]|uniref:Predicted protein n=1 Tax=Naegleria gruberi TaxID=5762 RepID=D2W1M5_NAEGR|nr:uncharacterized protein NAEGRDRAFT_75307 [Naegleria gruberi]EFC36993.1 predicted protein [Naegleria gruberi]|eukprot:XP_002669737.1 predicted protein [Naegleria gruberi strain NEG-M]
MNPSSQSFSSNTIASSGNYSTTIGNLSSPLKKKKSIQYYRKYFVQQPKRENLHTITNNEIIQEFPIEKSSNEQLVSNNSILVPNQQQQPIIMQNERVQKHNQPMKSLLKLGRKFMQQAKTKKKTKLQDDLDDEFSIYYKNYGGLWYFLKYYFLRFVQYLVMISSGCLAGSALSTLLPLLFLVFALVGFLIFFFLFSHSIQLF